PLKGPLLERLKKWNYTHVLTDGLPSSGPPGSGDVSGTDESTSNMDQDIREKEAEEKADQYFAKLVESTEKIFSTFQEDGTINQNEVINIVKEVMNELKAQKRFLLSIDSDKVEEFDVPYIVTHAVKTTLIALAIADFIKLPPHKQIELGTASVLHEIGMLRIPPEIYQHNRKLSEKERQTIIAHPVISFKVLKALDFPNPVALAVLEHHEYIDGTGYPRKLKGDDISFYGKILGVASSYAASTSKRPFREEHDGHTSIMDLIKSMGKRYDNKVLQALVFTLSIFPLGTYVQLSNGAKGLVIKTDPNAPKHPIIRLLANEKDEPYRDRPTIQPKEGDEVTVQRPLTKSEVNTLVNHTLQ
ncbi:MAG: HD-GYP domain-containing protein, partial [Spirochaetia bacterium]